MNVRTRREALKAAAKVALSISVVTGGAAACGGATTGSSDRGDPNTRQQEEATGELATRRDGGASYRPNEAGPTALDAAVAVVDSAVVETAAQCEAKLTASVIADADMFQALPTNDSAVASCCVTVLKDYEERITTWTEDSGPWPETQHRWSCCEVLRDRQELDTQSLGMACTPWGPPMPPSFEGHVLLEVA